MKRLIEFIKELQSADHGRKTRWLVGLSSASMVLVIAVWLSYFNNLVSIEPSRQVAEVREERVSRLAAVGNGFESFVEVLGGLWKSSWNYLSK